MAKEAKKASKSYSMIAALEDSLQECAHEYAGECNPDNKEALRDAAFAFVEACQAADLTP